MANISQTTQFKKNSSTSFIVKNIAPRGKRIQVFSYPIANQMTRDLLSIPYVSEEDIRHSLLKGEIMMKIRNKELEIVFTDINLLQFNEEQKAFIKSAGVSDNYLSLAPDGIKENINGVEIGIPQFHPEVDPILAVTEAFYPYIDKAPVLGLKIKENIPLLGLKNGVNRVFMTPDKFINGIYLESEYSIVIRHNGRVLDPLADYDLSESGGLGTGYDTIFFKAFVPTQFSSILANYTVK